MNTELSAKKILQQYHNAFYKLFHVPLDWIDQRNRTFTLCSNEHCHPLCRKIMEHRHGRESCEKLTSERIQRCRSSRTFSDIPLPCGARRCHCASVCGEPLHRQSVRRTVFEKSFRKTISAACAADWIIWNCRRESWNNIMPRLP